MRILQIITSLETGGAEKLIVDIVPRVNQMGLICDVMTLQDKKSPFSKELEKKRVKVISLSKILNYYNPLYIWKIIPYLKQYDLIHTHLSQPQYWTAAARAISGVKTPIITTEHNTSNKRINQRFFKPLEKWMYGQYEKIICISQATSNNMIAHTNLTDKIITLENGINVKHFSEATPITRSLIGLDESDFVVTMVAGFRPQKDHDTLIKVLKYLPEDVKVVFVGDGLRMEECRLLAKSEHVENRIFFLGVRTDVANILKSSNIVVMSSNYEGFGLAAVEGMAAGKPVIATNVEGLSEIVKDAGLLFELGNVEELKTHILKLKSSLDYTKNISEACFERSKKYDISIMVEKLIDIYKEFIKE